MNQPTVTRNLIIAIASIMLFSCGTPKQKTRAGAISGKNGGHLTKPADVPAQDETSDLANKDSETPSTKEVVRPSIAGKEAEVNDVTLTIKRLADADQVMAWIEMSGTQDEKAFKDISDALNPRKAVGAEELAFDSFVATGRIKSLKIVRNDLAGLAMAYVITSEQTLAEARENQEAQKDEQGEGIIQYEVYDEVYLLESQMESGDQIVLKSKMKLNDIFMISNTVNVPVEGMTALMTLAITKLDKKTKASELLALVIENFKKVQPKAE